MLFTVVIIMVFSTYILLLGILFGRRFRTRVSTFEEDGPSEALLGDETLVELIGVEKSFDQPVLKGISISVRPGDTLGILGMSGSGKSVMLKLIAGFLKPDRGKVLFRGKDLAELDEDELLEIRKNVSYVFQGGAVFDFLNVSENIAYPLRERGISDERFIAQRVSYLLDAVELDGMGDLGISKLSTGSKKQVAIARAIAINPTAILYDEPTTGVDPMIGKSLSRLIRKLNQLEELTSIVVTHDMKCLEIVADRILLLKDGCVHFEGRKEDFYTSQDPFIKAFLGGKRLPQRQEAS